MLLMMPPRSGKSELGSRHLPTWVLGKHPDWEIIAASHTSSLTLSFSRYIRDTIRDPACQVLFPDLRLGASSQSIENWNTTAGGGYLAAGVGTGITGRGAHILLLDDLVKDMEAADSATIRENTWDWYGSTAYTRLAPGGGVLGIMCMTGDTPVLLSDKRSVRRLDELCIGQQIATYSNGKLSTSTVTRIKSSGRDSVLKITMSSGRIVRANGRHPFLAAHNGELKWIRARSLTTASEIVTSPVNGASGKGPSALPEIATRKLYAGDTASRTMPRSDGQTGTDRPLTQTSCADETPASNIGTALPSLSTTPCLPRRTGLAPFANSLLVLPSPITGETNLLSTTATTQEKSEDCSATTATQESDILELSPWHWPLPGISDFTLERVVSIEPDGVEEVFDLSVERTENFIANGLVSHNTWWSEDDWAGRVQQVMDTGEGDKFEIVKYPAINEEGDEFLLPDDRIVQILPLEKIPEGARMTRVKGTAIHPERYSNEAMQRKKANLVASGQKRVWQALFQQNPTPDEGIIFTQEMFKYFTHPPQRKECRVYQAWDFAITEKQQNDWIVCCTIYQDEHDNLFIVDVLRFKSNDGNAIVEHIIDNSFQWGCDVLGFEDGQIWKTMESQYKKRAVERKHFKPFEVLPPVTDKIVRASPLKGRMQLGKVFVRALCGWTDVFVRELKLFPAGKHDDQVDAASWCVRLTLQHVPPPKKKERKEPSWRDKLKYLGQAETSSMAA